MRAKDEMLGFANAHPNLCGLDGQLTHRTDTRAGFGIDYISLGGEPDRELKKALSDGAITVEYQHTDALGTPVAVTSSTRSVLERSEYEPYGQLLNRPQHDGPGFTGHVEDALTGLTYMQQRYYDPAIGRFLSVDPVTAYDNGDMRFFNRYAYANNNPYKFSDPDGRCPNCVTGGIGAGVGLLFGLAVEGYRQYKAGDFDGRALAIEGGKGALVGGLTGLTGGAIGASALSVPAKIAATGGSSFAIGAAGDAAGAVASGNTPTVRGAVVAGSANVVGSAIGAIAKPAATAAATATTPAVKSHPVTSLTGRVFYTVNTPASSTTNKAAAESMQNAVGETAASSTSAAEKKLREH